MPPNQKDSLSTKFARWFTLYAAFLFLAGWSYQKSYFNVFGVDTAWLELGINDTIATGFSVLFGTGVWLTILYIAVFLLSATEELLENRSRLLDGVVLLLLVVLFPLFYLQATKAGREQANTDRGSRSWLPIITFSAGSCDYMGELFYVKSEVVYIYEMWRIPRESDATQPDKRAKADGTVTTSHACKFDVGLKPLQPSGTEIPQLFVTRLSELSDVRITNNPARVKP